MFYKLCTQPLLFFPCFTSMAPHALQLFNLYAHLFSKAHIFNFFVMLIQNIGFNITKSVYSNSISIACTGDTVTYSSSRPIIINLIIHILTKDQPFSILGKVTCYIYFSQHACKVITHSYLGLASCIVKSLHILTQGQLLVL